MKKILIFISFCMFAAASCVRPYEAHYDFGLDREELRFAAKDTASYFMIYGDGAWTLTMSEQVSWVRLDRMSGKGMTQINVRTDVNTGVARDVEVIAKYQDGREKTLIISQQTSSSSNKAYTLPVSELNLFKMQKSLSLPASAKFVQESLDQLTYWVEYDSEDGDWIEDLEFNYSDVGFSVKENGSDAKRTATIFWTFPAAHWETPETLSVVVNQTPDLPSVRLEESYTLDPAGLDSLKITPKENWDADIYDFDLSHFTVSGGVTGKYVKSGNYLALIAEPNTSREAYTFDLRWSVMDGGAEAAFATATLVQSYYIPPVDLTAGGKYANCYVLSDVEEGYYSVDVRMVSGAKPAEDMTAAEVLWQSSQGLITRCSYDSENNRLYVGKAKGAKGNAVVKLMNKDGNVRWSYHFWMTDAGSAVPEITVGGVTFLDRNIGALVNTAPTDGESASAGTYYQWGRKDPFPAPNKLSVANGVISTVYPEGTIEFQTKQTGVSLETTILNPNVYYWGDENSGTEDWSSVQNDNYWNTASKTDYDPCPYGYVVPNREQIDALYGAKSAEVTRGCNLRCDNGTTNWLPYGGWLRRKLHADSQYAEVGTKPHYWSTTAGLFNNNGNGSYAITNYPGPEGSPRRWGGTVRCVKETKTE